MKSTKLMLCFIACIIITYMSLGLIGYLLSDGYTYKECMTSIPLMYIMFGVGWIPALIVTSDLSDNLDKY